MERLEWSSQLYSVLYSVLYSEDKRVVNGKLGFGWNEGFNSS